MASKKSGKNSADKMAFGNVKKADIQTAAASTMEPADYQHGYAPVPGSLRNSYGRKK